MHPEDPQTLYFGTYRVWKTTNRGTSWNAVSGDLTHSLASSGFSTITTLAISKLNANYLLAGTDDGRVHLSTMGGIGWSDISDGLPLRWITRVAFDPFDLNTIYATVSGFRWDEPHPYVFRSTDLGQNWEPISNNLPELPVNVIIADPGQQNRLFVGTDAGIFYTDNGGENWGSLMNGMANVPVTDLKIHHPTRTLVAGTYGNSAYRLNLDLITNTTNPVADDAIVVLKPPFPNPVSSGGNISLEYYLPKNSTCLIQVTDSHGQLLATLFSGQQNGGSHHISWNLNDQQGRSLPAGLYVVHLQSGNSKQEQKLIIQ